MPKAVYESITRGIRVSAEPRYLGDQSDPDENRYVWSYTIAIENTGNETVQLKTRQWTITNGRGQVETVRGPGVVGEKPILKPGQTFRYISGCPLTTPSGIMVGSYRMDTEDGQSFDVAIPAFSLDSPFGHRSLN